MPFEKGQSGNPGGRPKADFRVRDLARSYTEEAIETAVSVMRDVAQSGPARVSALSVILDRGWGKAPQPMSGEDGEGPAEIVFRTIYEKREA